MTISTRIIKNTFDNDSLQLLTNFSKKYTGNDDLGSNITGSVEINILSFPHESIEFKLLQDKIQQLTTSNNILYEAHVLTAYHPYMAHTDGVLGEFGLTETNPFGYTFVTPLDDYDSYTLTYNQTQQFSKSINTFKENNPIIDVITDDFYSKHLTHESRDNMRYFSVETMFKWNKNNTLMMDRHRWHGSDNFHNRIPFKKAIICWTVLI
jgi:hypothetical protein